MHIYIYRCISTTQTRVSSAQESSVWLGFTGREQLISPECSQHQVLSLPKMLVVNKQKKLFSSVFSRVLNE